jgi:hypothetical protein
MVAMSAVRAITAVADEWIGRVMGVDPPSPGGRERGRDEGGDFLAARLIVGLSAESGFYIACRDAIKTLSSERRTSYFQRVNLSR